METNFNTYLAHKPEVRAFFDPATNTISYVVADTKAKRAAIIDSVMDYEPHSATITYAHADEIIAYVTLHGYTIDWILETHVHADHLTASHYLKEKLGGKIAIGKHIVDVQKIFGDVFGEGSEFKRDGSQFDVLWEDNDTFMIGTLPAVVLHVPGHTPADLAYVIGNAVFVGDTIFMPDYGTARCDFPGGSAETMYASCARLFSLPDSMRMFMCHDYLPEGRTDFKWEATVAEQKHSNIHLKEGAQTEHFVAMRSTRDATLGMPKLITPSIQVNMRAGELPKDRDGRIFFKIPVNSAFSKEAAQLL